MSFSQERSHSKPNSLWSAVRIMRKEMIKIADSLKTTMNFATRLIFGNRVIVVFSLLSTCDKMRKGR